MKLAMVLLIFHETSLHLIFQNSNSLLSGLVSLDVILKHVQIISIYFIVFPGIRHLRQFACTLVRCLCVQDISHILGSIRYMRCDSVKHLLFAPPGHI